MATRKLNQPDNPEFLALLVNSIDRIAHNAADLTDAEKRIANRLHKRSLMSAATRVSRHFQAIPEQRRLQSFGALGIPNLKAPSAEHLTQVISRIKPAPPTAVLSKADDVGPVIVPDADPLDRFTLTYTGIYCQDESDWDGAFTNSDEVYLITSVVEVRPNGENVVRTEKHPVGQLEYGDVDSGESRPGPVAACWQGSVSEISEISLTTTVMERDYGDPDHFREEVDLIVNGAVETLEHFKVPYAELLRKLAPLLIECINWLLGTADDLIAINTRIITTDALKLFADLEPKIFIGKREVLVPVGAPGFGAPIRFEKKKVTDVTDIVHHFSTTHKGAGATYVAGYRIRKRRLAFPATPVNA